MGVTPWILGHREPGLLTLLPADPPPPPPPYRPTTAPPKRPCRPTLRAAVGRYVNNTTLGSRVGNLNPRWNEDSSETELYQRFLKVIIR